MHDTIGVVLCGGLSSRFGSDKSTHLRNGIPMYAQQARILSSHFERVVVSCREDQKGQFDAVEVVTDHFDFRGPMNGLLSAMQAYKGSSIFLLATDYTGVQETHLDAILSARGVHSNIVAFVHSDGCPEPLCTLYESSSYTLIQQAYSQGRLSLRDLISNVRDRTLVPISEKWMNMNFRE